MARSCEFDPKTRSTREPVQRTLPVLRSRPSKKCSHTGDCFHSKSLLSRFTKKSFVNLPGRSVNVPTAESPRWFPAHACHRRAPSSQARSMSASERDRQVALQRTILRFAKEITEAIALGFEYCERLSVGHFLRRIGPARSERNLHRSAALRAASSMAAQPPSTIKSANDICLPPFCAALNSF